MHYPGHLHEEFQDVIVDLYVDEVCPTETHSAIAGRLWRCTDMLPGCDCETMAIRRGSTYAQAARQVKQDLPMLRSNWEQRQRNLRDQT